MGLPWELLPFPAKTHNNLNKNSAQDSIGKGARKAWIGKTDGSVFIFVVVYLLLFLR